MQEVTAIGKCNGFEIVGGRSELVALGVALGVAQRVALCVALEVALGVALGVALVQPKNRTQFTERLHPVCTKKGC